MVCSNFANRDAFFSTITSRCCISFDFQRGNITQIMKKGTVFFTTTKKYGFKANQSGHTTDSGICCHPSPEQSPAYQCSTMFFRLRIHRTHHLSRVKIRDLRADQFSPRISHEALQTPATGLTTPHSRSLSSSQKRAQRIAI